MSNMKTKRRRYSADFKAEICKLVISGTKTVVELGSEHDVCPSSIYAWVRQAKIDIGEGPAAAPTSTELEELRRLRKENRALRQERDFLASAARYFAVAKK